MTIIEIGKACSTHRAIAIYTNFFGNCQAKRPSEDREKDGKIMLQKYDVRVTWFKLSQNELQLFL